MPFQKNFMWGAATSAYQIEGAWAEDGRGASIWDVCCQEGGHVYENQTGNTACDHYHRFWEDVALMREIGLKAYRFSISWSRLLPEGTGAVNEAGVRFYDELINTLLDSGIEPYATLFHWDLPYALYQRGGWMNPDVVEWFGAYAGLVAERFSDRVTHFFTLNEPQCFVGLGFLNGAHAPWLRSPLRDTFAMAHLKKEDDPLPVAIRGRFFFSIKSILLDTIGCMRITIEPIGGRSRSPHTNRLPAFERLKLIYGIFRKSLDLELTLSAMLRKRDAQGGRVMTIREVSERYGLSADTLRYYERVGLIPPVPRTGGGVRDYDTASLGWVELIKCMRSAGVGIEALTEYCRLFQQGEETLGARKALLMEQRRQLLERMEDMQRSLDRLNEKIERYEQGLAQKERELRGG